MSKDLKYVVRFFVILVVIVVGIIGLGTILENMPSPWLINYPIYGIKLGDKYSNLPEEYKWKDDFEIPFKDIEKATIEGTSYGEGYYIRQFCFYFKEASVSQIVEIFEEKHRNHNLKKEIKFSDARDRIRDSLKPKSERKNGTDYIKEKSFHYTLELDGKEVSVQIGDNQGLTRIFYTHPELDKIHWKDWREDMKDWNDDLKKYREERSIKNNL